MSLDVQLLEKVRYANGRVTARCPACAEMGADRHGNHLSILNDGAGAYHCVADPDGAGGPHSKRIFELVGIRRPSGFRPSPPVRPIHAPAQCRIPPLRVPTVHEMDQIARSRGWPMYAGLEILVQRGLLWIGDVYDNGVNRAAWIITDATRRNADARRMDGHLWTFKDGTTGKAKALVAGGRGWPIGANLLQQTPYVLLTEGQPDFCAGPFVAWFEEAPLGEIGFVCMTGSGNSIHPDALPSFDGKNVRIAMHDDDAGRDAAERWATQLWRAGASVQLVDFGDYRPAQHRVSDLAEYAQTLDMDARPECHIFCGMGLKTRPMPTRT